MFFFFSYMSVFRSANLLVCCNYFPSKDWLSLFPDFSNIVGPVLYEDRRLILSFIHSFNLNLYANIFLKSMKFERYIKLRNTYCYVYIMARIQCNIFHSEAGNKVKLIHRIFLYAA